MTLVFQREPGPSLVLPSPLEIDLLTVRTILRNGFHVNSLYITNSSNISKIGDNFTKRGKVWLRGRWYMSNSRYKVQTIFNTEPKILISKSLKNPKF